jgi:quercetin dioxygenase-like cupin family protein
MSRALGRIADATVLKVWEGVLGRAVEGERLTLALIELEPDCEVPQHDHANEQLGLVIQGEITMTVGGERRTLGPGGTWRILGGVPHAAKAGPQGAVVIDVFSPVREDWRELGRLPPSTPRWPSV